jgi:hypothetical protein
MLKPKQPATPGKAKGDAVEVGLAAQLTQANALAQQLHADLTAARAEIGRLNGLIDTEAKARKDAEERAAQSDASHKAALESIPGMASRQAAAILGAAGHPAVGAGAPSSDSSATDPGSLRATFARMTPGSPEANLFWKQHRATLIGR